MPSVNQEIQDKSIRHLIQLLRLQNGEAKAIIKMLDNEVIPDLVDKISAAVGRMELSGGVIKGVEARRLQNLSGSITQILERFDGDAPKSVRSRLVERLVEIGQTEAQWESRMIQETLPIEWNTTMPSVNTLRSLVINQPFDGAKLDEWFSNLSTNVKDKINKAVRIGVVEGQTMDQIMQRIRGTAAENFTDGILHKNFRRHAEAITRTSVIHSGAMARNEFFQANDDLIKAVQWVSTLDTRTCEICMGLDGREFEIDGRQPPAHIQCRCVLVPVTKSWRELGIDLDEAPPGTRASMNGQVPSKQTYPEWLAKQSPKIQKEALGTARYNLWKAGNIDVTEFVNDAGNILSIEQLKRKAIGGGDNPVPDYKKPTSKPEAEQMMLDLGFKEANFNGLPLEAAQETTEGAYWLASKLGRLVDDELIFKKTASTKWNGVLRHGQERFRDGGNWVYNVTREVNISTHGQRVGDVMESWQAMAKRGVESGFFGPGKRMAGTSAHEMAHYYVSKIYDKIYGYKNLSAKQMRARFRDWSRTRETVEEIVDDTLAAIGKDRDYLPELYETIGTYSKTNAHETISVAVEYEFNNPGKNDFARELINQLRKRL